MPKFYIGCMIDTLSGILKKIKDFWQVWNTFGAYIIFKYLHFNNNEIYICDLPLTTSVWHFSLIQYEVKLWKKRKPLNSLSEFKISKHPVCTYVSWKLGKKWNATHYLYKYTCALHVHHICFLHFSLLSLTLITLLKTNKLIEWKQSIVCLNMSF